MLETKKQNRTKNNMKKNMKRIIIEDNIKGTNIHVQKGKIDEADINMWFLLQ